MPPLGVSHPPPSAHNATTVHRINRSWPTVLCSLQSGDRNIRFLPGKFQPFGRILLQHPYTISLNLNAYLRLHRLQKGGLWLDLAVSGAAGRAPGGPKYQSGRGRKGADSPFISVPPGWGMEGRCEKRLPEWTHRADKQDRKFV